ncbi:hypothetical protein M427DRAFT_134739 [Gonapodya prolifera JEL478]|uniref:Uncharacterized protein n=1 Tax=Gonapodya prolifera (strain JEL478) TaxID=1344416 RepID=A0A139AGK3_GONPJ|nr:hypothetical protein M427DRAFT_134739 [Gonapodya prolifera JEL478]|eukprot:KXS15941.1 hypothetical protein M427DRAFT_134739 [Gonapodya prolifera JEL478]
MTALEVKSAINPTSSSVNAVNTQKSQNCSSCRGSGQVCVARRAHVFWFRCGHCGERDPGKD